MQESLSHLQSICLGIATIEHDIVLITDLEKFLSLDEERVLDAALTEGEK
jgi:hypothetical protein